MDASSVLVLNQNYEPLNVCNVRRALILVLRGKAEIIESARSVFHTARATFVLPSVIRLVHMIKRPRPKVRLTRKEIFARDGWQCVYCGRATAAAPTRGTTSLPPVARATTGRPAAPPRKPAWL